MSPNNQGDYSLFERHRAVDVLADLQRLNGLDDLWTEHLNGAAALERANRNEIERIATTMLELLRLSHAEFLYVDELFMRNPDFIGASLERAFGQLNVSPDAKRVFMERLARAGGLVKALQASLAAYNPVTEIDWLNEKLRIIHDGGFVTGNMSRAGKCGLVSCIAIVACICDDVGIAAVAGMKMVDYCF